MCGGYTFPVPSPEKRSTGYLPGLDGLRAVAILGVLMAHDQPWSFAGHSNAAWHGLGGWGVELFFAISGVLICWRLLEDESRYGTLRLKAFYVRRFFRIQPAAWVYLLAVALLGLVKVLPSNWMLWSSAVFSFTNFVVSSRTPPGAAAFVGHFWTLSVEEHFYVLLSLFFLVARKRRTAALAITLALLFVAQDLAERAGLLSEYNSRRTYWTIQYLLVPALLAMLVRRRSLRTLVERFGKPWVIAAGWFVVMWLRFLVANRHDFPHVLHTLSPLGFLGSTSRTLFYGFGFLVIAIMLHRESWTTRVLEWQPLRYIGRLSYSIYLWHVLFFMPRYLPDQVHSPLFLAISGRPLRYLATAVCALLSYYLVEKPCIRLGHRLAPPATAGHADLGAVPAGAKIPVPAASTS